MKSNNKIKSIFTLCALLGVGSLFYSPQTLAQQQSDSSMLSPSSPTIGSLQQASSNTGGPTMQTATTRTEERYGTCPVGKVGVTSRTSSFLEAYRNITTYSLDGQVVGETVGPWIDNNEDCTGVETQSLACPPLMKGDYIQERKVVTGESGNNDNSAWETVKNTCAYYFVSNGSEERTIACPSGQTGTHTQSKTYENWSDGSKRNVSEWSTKSNTCKASQVTKFDAANYVSYGCREDMGMGMGCTNGGTYSFVLNGAVVGTAYCYPQDGGCSVGNYRRGVVKEYIYQPMGPPPLGFYIWKHEIIVQ